MFSTKTLAFLAENHAMNSREWFVAHKAEYEAYVLSPLRELMRALAPVITEIDGQAVTIPAVDKTISRIWCDVRFSRGMLFREQQWLSIRRDKKQFPGWPEFFMVFSPHEFFWGCGYYRASVETMEEVRRMILEGDPRFGAAKAAFEAHGALTHGGDRFKRTRYPSYPEDIRAWLDQKSICVVRRAELSELFDPKLAETMSASFRAMSPIYQFLIHAEELVR